MKTIEVKIQGMDQFFTQEAYKVLRTNIQFCGPDIKVIAITSAHENEGKSTVTLSLGQSFAELNKRVLIIDADMRKSVMAVRNTSIQSSQGLSEVLTGMATISDAIYATQIPKLEILMAGQYPPNPAELLNGKYFEALINGTRKIYDYILIDTPPLGEVIDSAVISSKCDGTIIVCADKASEKKIRPIIDQLRKGNCNILGLVMNSVSNKRSKYGYYGYKYGYTYGHGYKHEEKQAEENPSDDKESDNKK